MKTIKLQLKAKHFKGTSYCTSGKCAIEKAVCDHFGNNRLRPVETITECKISGVEYEHTAYRCEDFYIDKIAAENRNFNNTVIRTITLKPVAE